MTAKAQSISETVKDPDFWWRCGTCLAINYDLAVPAEEGVTRYCTRCGTGHAIDRTTICAMTPAPPTGWECGGRMSNRKGKAK